MMANAEAEKTSALPGMGSKTGEKEKFENADLESGESSDSPDFHMPAISSQKLTESILEAATSTDRFRSLTDQLFVMLSFVIGLNDIFRFPALCAKHGGVAFLIPYLFGIITVGAPLVYLESVFGQYTSLPPLQLFARLGVAYSGIGLATTAMAIMQVMLESSKAVSPMFALKCFGLINDPQNQMWLSCSFGTKLNLKCYDLSIKCGRGEIQSNRRCYRIFNDDGSIRDEYTWEQAVQILTNSSEALRQLPTQIYFDEILHPEPYPSDLIMSSVVFFNALVVAISMLGMRTYVKIAKFIVVCPMSVIILLTVMIFYKFGFRDSMLSIRSTLEPNFRKLMAIRAWTDAVLHVMPSLGVANGIFIVISSMKKFDNNAIRDTVFVVVVDILCSIFSCFLISPIIGYTASQMYAMTDKTVFGHKMRYLIGDWSQLPYTYMPSAFGHTSAELGLLSALYIAVFVMSLGPQVVALEMIVLTVYRTFPGLLQMDERISRKFICSAYLAAMFAYCYVANDEKTSGHFLETYYVLIPLPFLAILEIAVMVHLYRMPRFIVNMKTMLGKPPSKLWRFFGYPVGWYWTATLYVITPVTCCVTGVLLFFDGRIGETLTRANLFRAATAVLITPSIVVATLIYKVITTVKVGQSFRNLFVTDFKWGPKRLMDRQRAIHEEHAARIYT